MTEEQAAQLQRIKSLGIELEDGESPCPERFHYPPPGMWPSEGWMWMVRNIKPLCLRCNDTLKVKA